MPESLNEALEKLERLRPEKLDEVSRRIRRKLGEAEWEMCICLLAWQRQGGFRKLRYSTITEYAEKALHMSGQKVGWLLNAARALEHLPLMSQAFRTGLLCWGKLRALQSVVTPETEQQWLDYALAQRTDQVVKKVSASPREWKRHQALQASLEGQPTATQERVTRILQQPKSPGGNPRGEFSQPLLCHDTAPRTIRLTVELTPDQFALYEAAASRVRAQEGRYASRAAVVTKMAEAVLNQGNSRARARHQVVVHTNPDTDEAWYETSKGELPVVSEVVEEALKPSGHEVLRLEEPEKTAPTGGRKLTNATIRAVHARAGHCCERCGKRGGSLDIHHKKPVSEGGDNSLENLQLLCPACHTMEHESDFESKPHWREARASRIKPPPGTPEWQSISIAKSTPQRQMVASLAPYHLRALGPHCVPGSSESSSFRTERANA